MAKKQKHYTFATPLKKYLEEKLQIEKLIASKKSAGEILNSADKRRIKNNVKKKVDVLDRIVFPSMANLIYFFEFLNQHPELTDDFENDIEELFGLKGPHMNSHKEKDNKYCTGQRLTEAILNTVNPNDKTNFRLHLIDILQESLRKELVTITHLDEKNWSLYKDVALPDILRATAWYRFFVPRPEINTRNPNRIAGF